MSEECCICYESMGNTNITTTACGHTFCFSCIIKSMDAKNACPCCRAPLREQVEEESVMNPFEYEDVLLLQGDNDFFYFREQLAFVSHVCDDLCC